MLTKKDIKFYCEILSNYIKHFGKIKIYRSLVLKEEEIRLQNLGRFWSINIDKAFPYGGNNKEYYQFKGYIPISSIDFKETTKRTNGYHSHEKCLVLKVGAEVKIKEVNYIKHLSPLGICSTWVWPKDIRITKTNINGRI